MPRLSWFVAALLTASSAAGCSDEDPNRSLGERDAVSRQLPTMTPADKWEPDVTIDAGLVSDLFSGYEAGPCCDIAFALRAQDGEEGAVLRGSAPPLEENGITMTLDQGVWRATVCMPADYRGFYYYDVYLATDGGLPFTEQRINLGAPEGSDELAGAVNAFPPLNDCQDSEANVHSTLP